MVRQGAGTKHHRKARPGIKSSDRHERASSSSMHCNRRPAQTIRAATKGRAQSRRTAARELERERTLRWMRGAATKRAQT